MTEEAVLGANVFRDLFVGLMDIVGGRSAGYERTLRQARETAKEEMVAEAEQLGADAVVGVDVDYKSIQIGQAVDPYPEPPPGPRASCASRTPPAATPPLVTLVVSAAATLLAARWSKGRREPV